MQAFTLAEEPVIFPAHPRTRKRIAEYGLQSMLDGSQVRCVEPLGYLDMVRLEQSARMILTDSEGIQKEAYWLKVPCITLREETEWVETVEAGWNCLTGAEFKQIVQTVKFFRPPEIHPVL